MLPFIWHHVHRDRRFQHHFRLFVLRTARERENSARLGRLVMGRGNFNRDGQLSHLNEMQAADVTAETIDTRCTP